MPTSALRPPEPRLANSQSMSMRFNTRPRWSAKTVVLAWQDFMEMLRFQAARQLQPGNG